MTTYEELSNGRMIATSNNVNDGYICGEHLWEIKFELDTPHWWNDEDRFLEIGYTIDDMRNRFLDEIAGALAYRMAPEKIQKYNVRELK